MRIETSGDTMPLPFGKANPFLASVKEKRWLSKPGSEKQTYHIVLDLHGSGFQYHPGDSLGIFPINPPELVAHTLKAMGASGSEVVTDKHGEGSFLLSEFFTHNANITGISRKFLTEIAHREKTAEKKEQLDWLMAEGNKEALKAHLENHQVWDLLMNHPTASFTPQEVVNLLMPLLPRLYSIASSQRVVGDEVHLTVSRLSYVSNSHQRLGVCTYYLCDLTPLNEPVVPVYIQEHHGFTVPEDPAADIIMVGPGTGVAPFRSFMQERSARGDQGRNWLFFGECHRALDFFYEEFWNELQEKGMLQVEPAFSRDQAEKVYVQHRMMERGAELFEWLENGAVLFICGDAHRMAKDVDTTLHRIIERYGNKTEQQAKTYMKELRAQKRYLRDIY